jgi:hypothetical protein
MVLGSNVTMMTDAVDVGGFVLVPLLRVVLVLVLVLVEPSFYDCIGRN